MTDNPKPAPMCEDVEREKEIDGATPVRDRAHALELLDDVDSLVRFCSVSMSDVERYNRGSVAFWRVVHWIAAMREGVDRGMVETVEGVPVRQLLDSMTEDYVRVMRSTLAAIESGKNEPLQILRDQIRNKFAIANAAARDSEAA